MKRAIAGIIYLLLIINFVSSSHPAYIAGDITIYENGNAFFDIETNLPLDIPELKYENGKQKGISTITINKEGKKWTFFLNLTKYDSVFVNIILPKKIDKIIYITTENIVYDANKKTVTILDKQDFRVTYTLQNKTNYYSILFYAAVIFCIFFLYFLYKRKNKQKEYLNKIMPLINEKEQKIIDALLKKPERQKELRKRLNIPKASFSRYISNLEKKKLIIREGEGKNKILKLK